MLDIQMLRENPHEVAAQLARRGFVFDVDAFLALESERKRLQVATQTLQNTRNSRSKAIGEARARGEDIEPMRAEVGRLGAELDAHRSSLDAVLADMEALIMSLPNIPHPGVPMGKDETENVEIRRFGVPRTFDFTPKPHDVLGDALGQMDFAAAVKISGARFVVLKGELARLQRALTQFMLDVHTREHGYEEVYVPYIVNGDSLRGTGQLPKFEEDLFKLTGDSEYYLASTSEIPVTNIVRDTILSSAELPIKRVCHSPCFRSEAGSYGKDTRGLIRQHQFEKVELVWVTTPETSWDAHEQLIRDAETILQRLELPYRVVTLCTGDLGFSSAKTCDLEVWLPGQNAYREISSCSNMEAFQARRMKARYRTHAEEDTKLVHTLNGSGLAVGRTLVAILENGQDAEGNIHLPAALHPYMGGQTVIRCSR
ncbi:seryl-tRNA synthetase [Legionella geestiana]|uniref:Serine--tRNA ligase n=1 Tax=Legionella geestiana TaxID=45065 RepID=A0A0W0TGR1_9GAMM|nr:serine--tRNA ligase [Legionella geestiana]KTC94736.1 seryl-tRNA synthetase [Legionella geestiana]QBS12709.1 serine--tRNA ligase [Legionella geestiana]STX54825.1 seryl-tRNA synthetase [Legionella geestiana]